MKKLGRFSRLIVIISFLLALIGCPTTNTSLPTSMLEDIEHPRTESKKALQDKSLPMPSEPLPFKPHKDSIPSAMLQDHEEFQMGGTKIIEKSLQPVPVPIPMEPR